MGLVFFAAFIPDLFCAAPYVTPQMAGEQLRAK